MQHAFGAHVTVYAGDRQVVYLARHHGRPVFEKMRSLLAEERYRFFIGAKRVTSDRGSGTPVSDSS